MEVESFGSYFWISLSDLKHFGGRGNIEHKQGMERREGPGPLGPTLARPATGFSARERKLEPRN